MLLIDPLNGLNPPDAIYIIFDASGLMWQKLPDNSFKIDGLRKIQKQATMVTCKIVGVDVSGNQMRVQGTLSQNDRELYEVASHRRNLVAAGEYNLVVGVQTKNGNLYSPITKAVRVAETGETRVKVQVATPPSVRAKFIEQGKEQRGSLIRVFQNERVGFEIEAGEEKQIILQAKQ